MVAFNNTVIIMTSNVGIIIFYLSILGRRSDGYHDLSILMEKMSLFDELTLEEIPKGIELVAPCPTFPSFCMRVPLMSEELAHHHPFRKFA